MINARELRVGNFVNYNGKRACVTHVSDNHIGLSLGVIHDGFSSRSEHSTVKPELLDAIPLSEYILVTFGFRKTRRILTKEERIGYDFGIQPKIPRPDYFEYYELRKPMDFRSPDIKFNCFDGEIHPDAKIKDSVPVTINSLHALQNLFFSLSGEELKFEVDDL